jgi:hypothetical protein
VREEIMREKKLIGCVIGAVFIILISQVPYSVDSQITEIKNEIGYLPDLDIESYPNLDLEGLPHYLDGTILDGNTRVIISPDGSPPIGWNAEYDMIIKPIEARKIAGEARGRFIENYGVDPWPIEPEISVEYMQYMAISEASTNDHDINLYEAVNAMSSTSGPHQIGGLICTIAIPAKDSTYKPNDPYYLYYQTDDGFKEFRSPFSVNTYAYAAFGYWDASDVQSGDIEDLLYDLRDACGIYILQDNFVVMGWVDDASGGSGRAFIGGFFGVGKESSVYPKYRIAQHELSHCFTALDHGWSVLPICVMGYLWLPFGWIGWCGTCENRINNQIW